MTTPNTSGKRAKPPKPTPPKLIDLARWLFILSAVIGMGRFLYQLSDREMLIRMLRDDLVKRGMKAGQDELDAAVTGAIGFGVLLAIAFVLVYALFANKMAAGRNWARIVLTVLSGIGVAFGLLQLLAVASGGMALAEFTVSPIVLVLSGITMVIDAAVIVLMYRPSVAGYFRSVHSVSVKPPQVANGL
ncbi:hypothetical protein F4560_006105 [Saccharothrix ecbatanensis]|jgi:hypothetical protein|uniref:Uncharacterized protein n=1 Tax=Saccharothrix ecbatanensis TaxID=1105145 RepID=A0A7W9M3S4_9PSEU|nr:hypothetical protein [Saccharothrix ecbatanensis]MBB5806337.1 hypothetical protein [Saccharothrix ecbatanensis]